MTPSRVLRKVLLTALLAGPGMQLHAADRFPYDLVLCVDLSASNNGFLDDLRNGMWSILNGVRATHPGAGIRLGIVGYGRPSFGGSDGYVDVISDLTDDFDALSYRLHRMSASIEKGDQFVPLALEKTLSAVSWTDAPNAIREVFLVGNGSAYTGPVNLEDVCEEYARRHLAVSTLYIAPVRGGRHAAGYKRIAEITGGRFATWQGYFPPPATVLHPDMRFMVRMNDAFNSTLVFYSDDAGDRRKYTRITDQRILASGERNFTSRLFFKSTEPCQAALAPYDLVSYYIIHGELPSRIRYDFIFSEEHVSDKESVLDLVKKKAVARLRLLDEMRYLFSAVLPPPPAAGDNRLEAFILGLHPDR